MTRKSRPASGARSRIVTIRLPEHLIRHFRRGGPGYQTRIRQALEEHVDRLARLKAFEAACAEVRHLSAKDRRALALLDARPLDSEPLADAFGALPD